MVVRTPSPAQNSSCQRLERRMVPRAHPHLSAVGVAPGTYGHDVVGVQDGAALVGNQISENARTGKNLGHRASRGKV
jgi:hypothetical protein